jgi:hydrogenase nickel incorporation protein HypA/HybF
MHEMSLCEGIVQILQEQAETHQYRRVKTVCLELGQFSTVEISALEFCYEVVCRDTLAEGSKLEIIQLPGTAWCLQCGQTVTIAQRFDPCPLCHSYQVQCSGGDDMRIKELEVE